nr:5627_t:CDS:2 [Entrophospora candida]
MDYYDFYDSNDDSDTDTCDGSLDHPNELDKKAFLRGSDIWQHVTNNQYSKKGPINSKSISEVGGPPGVFKVLLLGGTGTGKSTVINTISNYFLGGTLDNLKVVIPTAHLDVTEEEFDHSEIDIADVTKSKTTKCNTYAFNHPENPAYRFIFIDTPGLSDTRGMEQDDVNIKEIIDTAISVGSISAIVVIANGAEPRMNPTIKLALVLLANNLPDAMIEDNLFLILTKCTKESTEFSVDTFTEHLGKPRDIFYMDNQAFCNDPTTRPRSGFGHQVLKLQWKNSKSTINDMLIKFSLPLSKPAEHFRKMKPLRNQIKFELFEAAVNIANIQKVLDKIKEKEESHADINEEIPLEKIVPANYHSTVCIIHTDLICHDRCYLNRTVEHGKNIPFNHCACMNSKKICEKCGCGPTSHFHKNVKLIKETKRLCEIIKEESGLPELEAAADENYKKIMKHCNDLRKVVSRFNFVDELNANVEKLKLDAKTLTNTSVRNNSETKIGELEQLINDLSSRNPILSR